LCQRSVTLAPTRAAAHRLASEGSRSISTALSRVALPALAPNVTLPRPKIGFRGRLRGLPFILLHVAAVAGAVLVAPTWAAVGLGAALYLVRMFGITAGYHRYFAHRAYKTSRFFQFVLAWLGCSAMQKGPLWWAGHHRQHHKHSDQEDDPHSPVVRTLWWAHVGWVISGRFRRAPLDQIKDYGKFWELRLLDRLNWVPGFALAGLCYLVAGLSGLVWGFLVSTVLLYHGTFLVNSACHLWGTRRYATTDQSKNNWWAAILTLGEGWHNNHHHYQSCARQGFRWWEVDVSYYAIRLLGLVGVVWDIREPTEKALSAKLISGGRTE
jgi:stearoyl-CoA desaturase (delta-9 desaturase)